jgi:AraC-like DNA-binding protein
MQTAAIDSASDKAGPKSARPLEETIARWAGGREQFETPVPRLSLYCREATDEPEGCLCEPGVSLIAQGRKRVLLGDEIYEYGAGHLLLTAVDLPAQLQVLSSVPDQPCLGLTLKLDHTAVSQIMAEGQLSCRDGQPGRAIAVAEASSSLVDAFRRLVGLLDSPEDVAVLAPLIEREILYRLLRGELGEHLRQIASVSSQSHQVARTIEYLKGHYREPLRVEELAERVGMGVSTFHRNFRAVTAMSPLQYRKWLRLNEARRLMLAEGLDAASAAFEVGYESPSQFNREYRRQFGAPPSRHITSLLQS